MTCDKFKFTQAARTGNIDYITEFLNSADAETKKEALAESVRCNDLAIVKTLLEGGADPNCKDKFRRPVLLKAVLGKNIDLVKTLIEAGADPNYKNFQGVDACVRAVRAEDGKPETPIYNLIREYADRTPYIL